MDKVHTGFESPGIFPEPLARLLLRLPQWPHSAALATALNLALLPALDDDMRQRLSGRALAFQVSDLGIDCRVRLDTIGFMPLARRVPPAVTIRASAADYWKLARRAEDPDTLFFARRLVIEGDTELGLFLKNTLDAIDWIPADWTPARRLEALARMASTFIEKRADSAPRAPADTSS